MRSNRLSVVGCHQRLGGGGRTSGAWSHDPDLSESTATAIRIDGGVVQQFVTRVDEDGEMTSEVGTDTINGLYRFRASSITGQPEWIQANESLRAN